jgi:hypothetical protein
MPFLRRAAVSIFRTATRGLHSPADTATPNSAVNAHKLVNMKRALIIACDKAIAAHAHGSSTDQQFANEMLKRNLIEASKETADMGPKPGVDESLLPHNNC